MGLFDFLKGSKKEQEPAPEEKYWSLATNIRTINDPTMEEIHMAVQNAVPDKSDFATLAYNNSRLEIEAIQVVGDDNGYYFEALTSTGTMYINKGLSYEETIEFFEDFYNHQRVAGFRSWPSKKY